MKSNSKYKQLGDAFDDEGSKVNFGDFFLRNVYYLAYHMLKYTFLQFDTVMRSEVTERTRR